MITYQNRTGLIIKTLFVGIISVIIAGCATINTGSHFDERNDFRPYRTFAWIDASPYISPRGENEVRISPLTQLKIERAIRAELEGRGYVFIKDNQAADFVLAYTVGTRTKVSVDSYPLLYRGPWGWHIPGSVYYEREYREHRYLEGTLGIDVFDGKAHQPVWHGWAAKTVTASDRKDPSASIVKSVALLFERFPR